jgi:hypothetical protein
VAQRTSRKKLLEVMIHHSKMTHSDGGPTGEGEPAWGVIRINEIIHSIFEGFLCLGSVLSVFQTCLYITILQTRTIMLKSSTNRKVAEAEMVGNLSQLAELGPEPRLDQRDQQNSAPLPFRN